MARVGVDIGGTFTDLVVIRDDRSRWTTKLLTTPQDPSIAFMHAIEDAISAGLKPGEISEIVHATTVATNAILESSMAKMGLITTSGFRDVIEIGRHHRRDLYNLFLQKPPPLVPRQLRLEARERVDAQGRVLTALDESDIVEAVRIFREQKVQIILVCFLHSYANPVHERLAAEIVARQWDVPIITSHSVCAEYREYERFSTAAVHGAVMPTVTGYLSRIESGIRNRKISSPLSIMQSNGGMASAQYVRRHPGVIIESGPAAGAASAIEIGRRLGLSNLIAFDMGGTTAKATLIRNGRLSLSADYEVGGGIQGGFGTGYPIRTPVVDLVEIGTGGGSIAWVDDADHLHVGPMSAGAEPGPACYGRGGTKPTTTDADLVLGRLHADRFAGGRFNLDTAAALGAIKNAIAKPLKMSVHAAAEGIVAIANAQMVRALQLVSVERGEDPREFTMVAFGGAGPMHAAQLAIELGCGRVVVPPEAGVQSAWGLLVADARRDFSQAIVMRGGCVDLGELYSRREQLLEQGRSELQACGFANDAIVFGMAVEVRYAGQSYELTIELPEGELPTDGLEANISQKFHAEHQRLYGHSDPNAPVQWITLRVRVIGKVPSVPVPQMAAAETSLDRRRLTHQTMYWRGESHESPVYERNSLYAGDRVIGPALIIQPDASIAVPPAVAAIVQTTGDIILDMSEVQHAAH